MIISALHLMFVAISQDRLIDAAKKRLLSMHLDNIRNCRNARRLRASFHCRGVPKPASHQRPGAIAIGMIKCCPVKSDRDRKLVSTLLFLAGLHICHFA
jgi:hypothetical protein